MILNMNVLHVTCRYLVSISLSALSPAQCFLLIPSEAPSCSSCFIRSPPCWWNITCVCRASQRWGGGRHSPLFACVCSNMVSLLIRAAPAAARSPARCWLCFHSAAAPPPPREPGPAATLISRLAFVSQFLGAPSLLPSSSRPSSRPSSVTDVILFADAP